LISYTTVPGPGSEIILAAARAARGPSHPVANVLGHARVPQRRRVAEFERLVAAPSLASTIDVTPSWVPGCSIDGRCWERPRDGPLSEHSLRGDGRKRSGRPLRRRRSSPGRSRTAPRRRP
jgi:hypothetical protein